jgi:hypothetical protein
MNTGVKIAKGKKHGAAQKKKAADRRPPFQKISGKKINPFFP